MPVRYETGIPTKERPGDKCVECRRGTLFMSHHEHTLRYARCCNCKGALCGKLECNQKHEENCWKVWLTQG